MKKPNVSKVIKTIRRFAAKRSPEILTGIGIAGMITTTVLAVKATPKALVLIDEAEYEKQDDLTKFEVVKVAWTSYIPAIVTGVAATACLVGASAVNAKRNAALATAYSLSQTALAEYKEKVIETIGEKKERAIKDEIAKDQIERNPVSSSNVIVMGKGKTLCFDGAYGRYFESDLETIRKAVNDLNRRMMTEMYISLNEFYNAIDVSSIPQGDELGWNLDRGFIEIDYSAQLADDGRPCMVINYLVAPRYDYSKLM